MLVRNREVFLTVKEAAEALGTPASSVYAYLAPSVSKEKNRPTLKKYGAWKTHIPGQRGRESWFIPVSGLIAFIQKELNLNERKKTQKLSRLKQYLSRHGLSWRDKED